MVLKFFLLIFAVSALLLSSAHASPPRSVDARVFDIAGVKIGMDFDQAMVVATNHLQAMPNEIKPCASSWRTIEKTKLPRCFRYRKDGVELIVDFVDRVPVDEKRPLAVWRIIYKLPLSQQNQTAMEEAALAKYGEPSWSRSVDSGGFEGPGKEMSWCIKPGTMSHHACTQEPQAVLVLGWTSIKLIDPTWPEAEKKFSEDLRKAQEKALEDTKTRKANF